MKTNSLPLCAFLLLFLNSCQNRTENSSCFSKNLSTQQKEENNLFLNFYYGMTPEEFKREEEKLIKEGVLFHSDSTTKFVITTNYEFTAKSVFIITPSFDQCTLYALDAEYIAPKSASAMFKSYSLSSNEMKKIPDESNVADVEKLYREKYGTPHASKSFGIEEGRNLVWRVKNKEISTHKLFGESTDFNGKPYKQLSQFYISYKSVKFDEINKLRQDSIEKINTEKIRKQAENTKNSI